MEAPSSWCSSRTSTGHPQYLSEDEKKEHLRFLWKVASSYGFDIPLMGNDTQFAQDMKDPILSQIYGTADAYFGGFVQGPRANPHYPAPAQPEDAGRAPPVLHGGSRGHCAHDAWPGHRRSRPVHVSRGSQFDLCG